MTLPFDLRRWGSATLMVETSEKKLTSNVSCGNKLSMYVKVLSAQSSFDSPSSVAYPYFQRALVGQRYRYKGIAILACTLKSPLSVLRTRSKPSHPMNQTYPLPFEQRSTTRKRNNQITCKFTLVIIPHAPSDQSHCSHRLVPLLALHRVCS